MRKLTWVDPDGALLSFGGGSVLAGESVQFAGMPQIRASELAVPLQPGARWRQVDHGPREVAVPVVITAATLAGNESAVDDLVWALDPSRGDGRLRATRHDGTERELTCRYVSSLQITEQKAFDAAWQALCVFRAVDPYWYDSTESTFLFAPAGSPGTFFPFFPLVLGASEASTSATVANDGHVASWPIWEIVGPGNVTATNVSTGESWDLDYSIDAGDVVTVDTRPGVKSVTSVADGNLFANLTGTLWQLGVGDNDVSLTMSGATADSRVLLRWARRWLTA